MVEVVEAEFMINAYWPFMYTIRPQGVVVELVVLAHLDKEFADVIEFVIDLLFKP